ncbi:hypothetical protein BX666DRAFT_1918483 [Dichotomocladium elegans]|nr:hypothetical protein BX666DRAFT_1918483 [Dichotomocladium elegans]
MVPMTCCCWACFSFILHIIPYLSTYAFASNVYKETHVQRTFCNMSDLDVMLTFIANSSSVLGRAGYCCNYSRLELKQ